MIEVFKTDISSSAQASHIAGLLVRHFPGGRISVDLQDCDRVLRVEAEAVCAETVIRLLADQGFACCVLDW
ncbi:hypothetical protein [Sediminibacterium soli]|uniref:hypothetical protein n=1 Tax=Sediminibacterium soli TaxID=2698829 RepID=UPI0013799FCD|nr:hypothetical protein [Sediminibacterium soli]NCI45221.1 hypothetical protein [Sediminibacterium soli]